MPMERRTRAPAPSACSLARKARRTARGVIACASLLREGSLGGTTARPGKGVELLVVAVVVILVAGESLVMFLSCVRFGFLVSSAASIHAMVAVVKKSRRVCIYGA